MLLQIRYGVSFVHLVHVSQPSRHAVAGNVLLVENEEHRDIDEAASLIRPPPRLGELREERLVRKATPLPVYDYGVRLRQRLEEEPVENASVATQGAMYPAAWEAKRGPTASECVALEGPGYTPPPSVSGAPYPLVYAVGGLDGRDQPLENSRDHGRPRLNAYGFAVVSSNVGSGHTEPMTGTSMATAVASSAAAVLWAYKPDLTPREVALGLLASATPLTATPADLCFGPANCGVAARISVGGAYARAECGADAACASQLAPNLAAYAGKNPFWTTTDAWTTSIPGGVAQLGDVKACTNDASPACADPVSSAQTKEATPWVKPQPGAHGCDICGVGGSQLFVTLDPSIFQSTKLGYLTLYGVNGALVQYVVPVPAGAQTFSVGSVAPPPGGTTSAAISFKVNAPTGTFVTHEQIPTW